MKFQLRILSTWLSNIRLKDFSLFQIPLHFLLAVLPACSLETCFSEECLGSPHWPRRGDHKSYPMTPSHRNLKTRRDEWILALCCHYKGSSARTGAQTRFWQIGADIYYTGMPNTLSKEVVFFFFHYVSCLEAFSKLSLFAVLWIPEGEASSWSQLQEDMLWDSPTDRIMWKQLGNKMN